MDQLRNEETDYGYRHAQRTAYLIGSITAWIGFAKDGQVTADDALTEIRLLIDDHRAALHADDERAEANR